MFDHSANLSGLEYVPMTTGFLMVDLVVPVCPMKTDQETGELVSISLYCS